VEWSGCLSWVVLFVAMEFVSVARVVIGSLPGAGVLLKYHSSTSSWSGVTLA